MTKKEWLAAARSLSRRQPAVELDKCRACGNWCVSNLGLGDIHPLCVEEVV